MRDVGYGIFQKVLCSAFIFCMSIQNCSQRIDLVKKAVQFTLFITVNSGILITGKILPYLRYSIFYNLILFPKIQVQSRNNKNSHQNGRYQNTPHRILPLQTDRNNRNRGKTSDKQCYLPEKVFDFSICQNSHSTPHSVTFHL